MRILPAAVQSSMATRKAVMTYRYTRRVRKPEKGLIHLNIEVTRICNAWCSFCDCPGVKKGVELTDYTPVVARLKPMIVSFSGGEPMLRKDLVNLIQKVHAHDPYIYLSMTTNASLLTLENAKKLKEAGLDAIVVSLDFLDERHDEVRGIKGLTKRIMDLMPKLPEVGFDRVGVQAILSEQNLDQIIPITEKAAEWGVHMSYNPYCEHKADNIQYRFKPEKMDALRATIDDILRLKKKYGHVRSSKYLLNNVVRHFEKGDIGGCQAGIRWLVCEPDGMLKRCPDFPREVNYTDFTVDSFEETSCTQCWYGCRVEGQAPVGPSRWIELFQS